MKPEDFVVFSVNQTCVWNRFTDFQVRARLVLGDNDGADLVGVHRCPPTCPLVLKANVHAPGSGSTPQTPAPNKVRLPPHSTLPPSLTLSNSVHDRFPMRRKER